MDAKQKKAAYSKHYAGTCGGFSAGCRLCYSKRSNMTFRELQATAPRSLQKPLSEIAEGMLPDVSAYGELRPMVRAGLPWHLHVAEHLLWLAPTLALAYSYWRVLS